MIRTLLLTIGLLLSGELVCPMTTFEKVTIPYVFHLIPGIPME